jgi:hypothetical protein
MTAPAAELVPPSQATLDKYGLSMDEWLGYIVTIDGVPACRICEKPPRTGRFVVDHKHTPRWKDKPPEERKRYVRGVICTTCNHYVLTRYGSPLRHRNAAAYLEEFERRLADGT